jgi:molecular chaperone GrpE
MERNSPDAEGAVDPPTGTPTEWEPAQAEADAARSRIADLQDRLLRALAEQENLRRRAARERDDAVKFAAAEVVKDLLPAIDNLRRAIDSVPQSPADELLNTLLDGVAATERSLLDALERHGIRRIEPAPGEPFDPDRHQAIYMVGGGEFAPGTVTKALQPGFVYRDRLLRPALVAVAQAVTE